MKSKTEWADVFLVLPKKVEGRWMWLCIVQERHDNLGALGLLIGACANQQWRRKP